MRFALVVGSLLLPASLCAQEVVVRDAGPGQGAGIVRKVVAGPHVVRAGAGPLEFPRDSIITTSLLVLGRPTYLASEVRGDVVVVGADLFLRPGVDITGRAVVIGGTVAGTTLGRVAGGVESLRDESFTVERMNGVYALDYRSERVDEGEPVFQLAGYKGLQIPEYDRVNGLSLPAGALIVFAERKIEIEPAVTYRSRLGRFDPGVSARLQPTETVKVEARVARDTRTNDGWIYSDLVNSAATLFAAADTRNYFRANVGEGRLFYLIDRSAYTIEPFIGGRYEEVSPIAAAGNVFSFFGRNDSLRMRRPNPLVEKGSIGSALAGVEIKREFSEVAGRLRLEAEQSFSTPGGTSKFLQLTLEGALEFPTVRTQTLRFEAHGVVTSGDSVPRARYAYLGGSGTLPLMQLLEQGGDQLVFLESRYRIPIPGIQLPYAGAPTLWLRDIIGAAGVKSIPRLEHEVGIGVGLSILRLDVTTDASGDRGTKVGVGVSLSR